MLESRQFATAGRHSRLLHYLVERTLAGEGDQHKEYALGTDVFDPPDSFDPRIDSIVRVELRRLCKRLDEYYGGPGASDPVVIKLHPGRYAPEFQVNGASHGATSADDGMSERVAPEVIPPATSAGRRRVTMMLSAVGVVVAVLVVWLAGRGPAAVQPSTGIAVLPFEHYSTSIEDAALAARATDALTVQLAKLGIVSVASRMSASRYRSGSGSVPAIAAALHVDFVLEGTTTAVPDGLQLQLRLVDARLDRKVWVRDYVVRTGALQEEMRAIAADAAAAMLGYRRPG